MAELKKTVARLESAISTRIFEDNRNTVHFQYHEHGDTFVELIASTYNPERDESFLLKEVAGITKEDCLEAIIKYLDLIQKSPSSFTVTWVKKGEGMNPQRSYFYCEDVFEVAEKFYQNKVRGEYNVFSIVQNPVA